MDYKFILNLKKEMFPGVRKVTRMPGIEKVHSKTDGKLSGVSYFFDTGSDKHAKKFRFVSKDNFKTIHCIDVYNLSLIPVIGIQIKEDMPKDKFIQFVTKLILTTKYKRPQKTLTESFTSQLPPELTALGALYGVIIFFTLFYQFRYYFVKLKNLITERYMTGPAEQAINEKLFGGQTKDEPAFFSYAKVISYIQILLNKKFTALIICGPPGMSKTYIIRRTLHFAGKRPRKDYAIEKGATLGIADVYSLLYYNRKRLLILDDFDTPLQTDDTINLLKSITDSYSRRIVSLPTAQEIGTTGAAMPAAPKKFEFKGQILIITNLTRDQIPPALVSRAPVVEVNFNAKQVMELMEKCLKFMHPDIPIETKKEVYNYIILLYKKNPKITVDFRAFQASIDARIGNPMHWKDMIQMIVNYKGK